MIIEGFKGKFEREKAEKYEEQHEAVPPSVVEILNNPQYFDLLISSLEKDNKQDLIQKISKRENLAKEDFDALEAYRIKIKEALDFSQEIISQLSPEVIKIIADASPEFNNLVGKLGINKTQEFIKAYLAKLYIIVPEKFQDLASKINEIKEADNKLKDIDHELKDACRRYGISESELARIYERGGSLDEIQRLVYSRLNILERIWNFLRSQQYASERINELNKVEDIKAQLEEIYKNLAEIGKMIADAVFGTEAGLELLSKAVYGTIEPLGGGLNFKEFYYSEEELERYWQDYLEEAKQQGLIPANENWGSIKSDKKDYLRSNFPKWFRNKKFRDKSGTALDILIGMVGQWVNNNKQ